MNTRARVGPSTPALAAFVCELGHEMPYWGGPIRVASCTHQVGIRTQCGATARVRDVEAPAEEPTASTSSPTSPTREVSTGQD